jgi:antitoxin (DNA-binding transcriptional repressor) of toxin-antitoxin stability system
MDEVHRTGTPFVVTKHGTPIVRIVPASDPEAPPLFGRLKGSIRVTGDIIAPIDGLSQLHDMDTCKLSTLDRNQRPSR